MAAPQEEDQGLAEDVMTCAWRDFRKAMTAMPLLVPFLNPMLIAAFLAQYPCCMSSVWEEICLD